MVTGSRKWTSRLAIEGALTSCIERDPAAAMTLMHGDCEGADRIAASIAKRWCWREEKFPADWVSLGLDAGKIRNSAMIAARPDIVLAFPLKHSRGTWDAVNKAKAAGIPVVVVNP